MSATATAMGTPRTIMTRTTTTAAVMMTRKTRRWQLLWLLLCGLLVHAATAIVTGDEQPDVIEALKAHAPKAPAPKDPAPAIATSDSGSAKAAPKVVDNQHERAAPPATAPHIEILVEQDERSEPSDYMEDDLDMGDMPIPAIEVKDKDASSKARRQNYASLDAGATILDSSPETKSPTNLLVPDKDRYMLIPCAKPRKWVVVSLSEDIHADAIVVANYEKFSSPVKDFLVLGSVNYPTDTWYVLGNFTAKHTNGEQVFPLDSQYHVRYIKLRFFSHYGSEYYCTLSQLKVFGRTFTQVISQLEKSIEAENALDSVPQLPLPTATPPAIRTVKDDDRGKPPTTRTAQCSVNTTTPFDFLRKSTSEMCPAPKEIKRGPAKPTEVIADEANSNSHAQLGDLDEAVTFQDVSRELLDGSVNSSAALDGTAKAVAGATSNGTAAVPSQNLSPASMIAGAQGLGRLESIFVRITKKIQSLELNQSLLTRQLDEMRTQQQQATMAMEANQETLGDQLSEIKDLLADLQARVIENADETAETLHQFGKLLDGLRRENVALWSELLLVREVITTMKAGIFFAIVLSCVIISFYLLRLLFRCVTKCKRRADLREWFWHLESTGSGDTTDAATTDDTQAPGKGALSLNKKQQLGSGSWDDSAIERKTLYREMVGNGPQSFRRGRFKKHRASSVTFKASTFSKNQ